MQALIDQLELVSINQVGDTPPDQWPQSSSGKERSKQIGGKASIAADLCKHILPPTRSGVG
jgi:hypothetical protein